MEFMSIRGLRAWAESGGNFHCILDDMEAVSWLLAYTLVARKPEAIRTIQDNLFLEMLSNRDAAQLAGLKAAFIGPNGAGTRIRWNDEENTSLRPIVKKWLEITAQLNGEAEAIFSKPEDPEDQDSFSVPREPEEVHAERLRDVAHQYFSRYLMAGLEFLKRVGAYGSSA